MKVVVLQEVDVVQVVVDDEDVDENNDKDDSDNDIDEDDDDVEIDVQESSQIDVVELGIDEDKGRKQRKDDRFEENATEVLDAHVVVRKMMAQFGQVDVGKDGDTRDDDDLVDVARHVLVEDEDKGLCAVELFSDMLQVRDAQTQVQYMDCLDVPKAVPILDEDEVGRLNAVGGC